jgi:riboflavin kinase/FMN adenylyltransferase
MAETHLLGYEGNLYGTCCRTALLHFIRAERKFPDMNALQNAIAQDCMRARQLAENISEH